MKALERNVADPVAVRNVDVLNQELAKVSKVEKYFGDCTAGALIFPLPNGYETDFDYFVLKTDSGGNTITILPFGTQTINGATDLVLSTQYSKALLTFYRGMWYIISS